MLADKGIMASEVGEVVPPEEGISLHEAGAKKPLEHPRVDPFWEAFGRQLQEASENR